ncbi:hypothetical protein KY329_01910, partial [Candidatus Woesearchaeota archaeon]|nr:hypothetical protein [Candidatus Woesearchaeota archaeon]
FLVPWKKSYPGYSLQFASLPWWSSYFDLNCNGELRTAESADMPLHFMIGMRQYRFQYDMSYPVLVVLHDANAFSGEGFTFQFFLETNMRNNVPLKGLDIKPDMQFKEPSIFCNPDQFESGDFRFSVKDKVSKRPVNASVMFRCGPETCVIGEAVNGELDTKLPKCVNGVLIVTAPNYMQFADLLSTTISTERSMLLEMLPAQEVEVSASKFLLMKQSKHGEWQLESAMLPESVDADENVIVTLTRKKQAPFDTEYSTFAEINGNEPATMQIMPGEYTIRVNSVKYPSANITIPVDRRCKEFGVWPFDEEVCYDLPEEPLVFNADNPMPYGTAEYDAVISADQLRNANRIIFRYVAVGIDQVPQKDRVIEDMNEYGKLDAYSASIKNKLRPVIT